VILHQSLPHYPWADPVLARLPGVQPLADQDDYLRRDEAFAGQMALRDTLIATARPQVFGQLAQADAAVGELMDMILARLRRDPAYVFEGTRVYRPDGIAVDMDGDAPLPILGRLVQEDLCLLQDIDGAPHLTAAILCFPASWTLEQKLGRSMARIHAPVGSYTSEMGARIERMFRALRPEQGLWRMNYLTYAVADLHHPLREETPRDRSQHIEKPFVRCERQCLTRLPQSRAILFSIHSYVMRRADLPDAARQDLPEE